MSDEENLLLTSFLLSYDFTELAHLSEFTGKLRLQLCKGDSPNWYEQFNPPPSPFLMINKKLYAKL